MTTRIPRTFSLLTTLLILTLGWFAVPYASQEGANDGFILFSTNRDHPSDDVLCPGCEEIYVMLPDGSNPTRITNNAFNHKAPDWSHSKKTIAFHSNGGMVGGPEIFLMNLDGTDQRLVASLGAVGAQFPSFSPNGNELCFNSQTIPRDIYIVNVHGGGLTNLTNGPADDFRCAWSPKGDDILVSSRERKANSEIYANAEIYVVTADGSAPVRLTTNAVPTRIRHGRPKVTASPSKATGPSGPKSG